MAGRERQAGNHSNWAAELPMSIRDVEVVAYQSDWVEQFRRASTAIQSILGDEVIAIHHIGSTSVPGLSSKPIIDMLAVLHRFDTLDSDARPLAALGYTALGEFGIRGRRYFRREDTSGRRTHHVHCFLHGSFEIERHLAFRDYLRANPSVMNVYADLKLKLAKEHPHDIDAYMDGKDPFIKRVEEHALAWRRGPGASGF